MIVVAFLFPLAVYCLILGLVNRRRHPLMVSAAWDFAGLLVAASGLLAFGIPGILSGFSERGRHAALFGEPPASNGGTWGWFWDLFEGLCSTFSALGSGTVLIAYFVLVVAGCALLLWRRRGETAVYNVHPEVLDEVLSGVLDAAGLTWARAGPRYFIRRAPRIPADRPVKEEMSARDWEGSACLEVDAVPALCHVTLRWDAADEELRQRVEGDLARALAEVRTRDNAAGSWLLLTGSLLLCTAALLFLFVVLYRVMVLRG